MQMNYFDIIVQNLTIEHTSLTQTEHDVYRFVCLQSKDTFNNLGSQFKCPRSALKISVMSLGWSQYIVYRSRKRKKTTWRATEQAE